MAIVYHFFNDNIFFIQSQMSGTLLCGYRHKSLESIGKNFVIFFPEVLSDAFIGKMPIIGILPVEFMGI